MKEKEIIPGQVFKTYRVDAEYGPVHVGIQIVLEDGRVVVSPVGDRKRALIVKPNVLLKGGIVSGEGKLGRLLFPPPL